MDILIKQSASIYPIDFEINNSVSSSLNDPIAILRKLWNSFLECRPAPSEMFAGIETAALLIWEMMPNFSLDGNWAVIKYSSLTN